MDSTEQRGIRRAATVAAAVMTASLIVGVAVGTGGPGGHRGPGGPNGPVVTTHSTGSMKPVGATGTADRDTPPAGARARTPDAGPLRPA
ncbi:hypothetical protein [Streptomyces sp. NPDC014733]|uniref:hypothetical protein n=1 Tax=Streptomyces sp. NPDC014733 TaxID=3364885 RepID=UPI0037028372